VAAKLRHRGDEEIVDPDDDGGGGRRWLSRADVRRSWKPWVRGAAIGFPFGALPAGGAEIPTFLSYSAEKRLTRHPEEFGRGAIEGVAGPEAANNASFSGTLVPLLTLGIPTSATAAIMLSAFQIFNLQPGPELFARQSGIVWALIASLYVGNVMLLVLNLPLIRVWVRILEVPRPLLTTGIMAFGVLGAYTLSNSTTEVLIMLALGALGFLLRRGDLPIAPVILGVILGPLMESQFRRTLIASDGDLSALVSRPLSIGLVCVTLLAVALPYAPALVARLRGRPRAGVGRLAFGEGD
jgi:putative tricarboxylic transport membrane protein